MRAPRHQRRRELRLGALDGAGTGVREAGCVGAPTDAGVDDVRAAGAWVLLRSCHGREEKESSEADKVVGPCVSELEVGKEG